MLFNQELLIKSMKRLPEDEQRNFLAMFDVRKEYEAQLQEIKEISEAEKYLVDKIKNENLEMRGLLLEVYGVYGTDINYKNLMERVEKYVNN